MKLNSTLLAITFSLAISGCASTRPELPVVNGKVVFPPLTLLSEERYAWDDSKSEALNIAHMALPANVGNGLRDMENGENASTGRIGSGTRIFDAALGLAGFGLFGILQSESLAVGVNNAVDWNPAIVEIVSKETITRNGNISYESVRDLVSEKVKSSLRKAFHEIEFGSTLTLKSDLSKPSAWIQIYSADVCSEARPFESRDKSIGPFTKNKLSSVYYDGNDSVEEYCAVGFDFSVTQVDQNGNIVIVAEMNRGLYFAPYLSQTYEGYMIFPNIYDINPIESVVLKYPFVSKSGKELLFTKPR